MIRLRLTSRKQTMPLTQFLLSGWVSTTRLSAVNVMNQRQEEDIPQTGALITSEEGKSSWYGETEALPSLLVHGWRVGIDFQQTHCSTPPPSTHPVLPTSQPMEALTRAGHCEMEDSSLLLPYILYTTEYILTKLEGWWLLLHLHVCSYKAGGCTLATCCSSNDND